MRFVLLHPITESLNAILQFNVFQEDFEQYISALTEAGCDQSHLVAVDYIKKWK